MPERVLEPVRSPPWNQRSLTRSVNYGTMFERASIRLAFAYQSCIRGETPLTTQLPCQSTPTMWSSGNQVVDYPCTGVPGRGCHR